MFSEKEFLIGVVVSMNIFLNTKNHSKGMTLLISVLIISTLLSVALSLLSFVIKQFKISSSSQQSVLSIYAADAGVECALLWDIRGTELYGNYVFATSSLPYVATSPKPPVPADSSSPDALSTVECFELSVDVVYSPPRTLTSAVSKFEFSFPVSTPTGCVIVEITKNVTGPTTVDTSILSRGYNVPCANISTSPITVERAIRVDY